MTRNELADRTLRMLPLGPVAHLVERRHGMAEATGSIPVGSTSWPTPSPAGSTN